MFCLPRSSYPSGCEVFERKTGCTSRLLAAGASLCTGTARYAHNSAPAADACTEQSALDSLPYHFLHMDQQALDYTRDHYNKHVKHQDSKEVRWHNMHVLHAQHGARTRCMCLQALRQRKEGPSLPLKELHNDVKRQLIYRQGMWHSLNAVYLQSRC